MRRTTTNPGIDTMLRTGRMALVLASMSVAACDRDDALLSGADGGGSPYQFASAEIEPLPGTDVSGVVRFDQDSEFLEIEGRIEGLSPGRYRLRVYDADDCTLADGEPAGELFSLQTGTPELALEPDLPNEAGRLGEFSVNERGVAEFQFIEVRAGIGAGDRSILDRALFVYALDGPPARTKDSRSRAGPWPAGRFA